MSFRPSLVLAIILAAAAPVAAQFQSEGYKFLQAVKDSKNNEVIAALNKPGSTVVNTKDVTSGEAALHIVARRGDVAYTAFLLQKGADPNIRDGRGNTPLILAIDSGNGELVPILLSGKASPNLATGAGVTPLIRAVQMRNTDAVRSLLAVKANPDQKDYSGASARDYAERDARAGVIAKLFADTPRQSRAAVAGPKL
ncbi:ankyrin repeat domain-containing protein [Sphingomonas sp.]|jgi:ankyrin repeat protein|uniref:ankyrin repeat domain-containing protein n=1 Tax=Sphingomonas sp. TaxID=28214 RepID=UPI002D7E30F2|nr:ankyrin repeat domain-containing protein [Sphingomonas sp.]HEU0045498.1 ankyrin repeat domain-containing protein [Sphingomonas sp.]